MINRSILSLIFILGIGAPSFPDGELQEELYQEDLYVGETIEQIILLLGKPSSDGLKMINEKYIGYESEPHYSVFFSADELQKTVTIRVVTWEKENKNIVVWGKKISDEWVIFSSLESGKNVYF
jgi:hypothetical protein